MVNLSVRIGRLRLKNPVMAASGTFGPEYGDLVDINSLGAYVSKTITLLPRLGNVPPRIVETPSGMLNSIGLENNGVEDFLKNKLPSLKGLKTPIIASIAGDDAGEFEKLAKRLAKVKEISALELNLSCPNIKYGKKEGMLAQDKLATYDVVKKVRKATGITVIAKLSPNVSDITKIAEAAEAAGADAVSLVNTFVGMAVDIEAKKPSLGNVTGGLSGPAIKPLAIRMVWEVYNKVRIPVIGMGGITDYKDAIEFIICGSTAVQLGTVNFINPKAPVEILAGIKNYLAINRMRTVRKLVGTLRCEK